MNWAGLATLIGEGRDVHRACRGILRERDHLENPDLNERIILNLIFVKLKWAMEWIEVAQDTY